MESGGSTHASAVRGANALSEAEPRPAPIPRARRVRVHHIQTYRLCDALSEGLIYLMVLFGPWAFGTTQTWAIWTMTIAGYTLGGLLLGKWLIRCCTPYRPPRWTTPSSLKNSQLSTLNSQLFTGLLGLLTLLLLAYTLTSALNARATYSPDIAGFKYHDPIPWLPHSFDSAATWFTFWTYLGLAAAFWAIRDWLLGKTTAEAARREGTEEDGGWRVEDGEGKREKGRGQSEERGQGTDAHPAPSTPQPSNNSALEGSQLSTLNSQPPNSSPSSISHSPSSPSSFPLPARLRRLLWLLAINGAILGLEGILQRVANCPKLLFLLQPRINSMTEAQFGPYAYRSNAGQYFNLLWPVCLGFWWTLNRAADRQRQSHHLLLLCAGIMAACPIIASTRAGALTMGGMLLLAILGLLVMEWRTGRRHRRNRRSLFKTLQPFLFFALGALVLGLGLGYKTLAPRLAQLEQGYEGRESIYEVARQIADAYPVFGTGPGTYASVSEAYRPPGNQFTTPWGWPAQVHNDFLETLITFGWVGTTLVYLALACVLARWFVRGGIHGGRRFVMLIWLALAGCFLQARFDFPFQIHSILFLFLLLCAILSVLSRRAD